VSWPTQEQFDQAHQHGTEYALQERANGSTGPQEAPLSGEWADGLTPRDVARNVGWDPQEMIPYSEGDAVDELADAWERGYNDAWAHSIESTT
jgi:hypothetical protein